MVFILLGLLAATAALVRTCPRALTAVMMLAGTLVGVFLYGIVLTILG